MKNEIPWTTFASQCALACTLAACTTQHGEQSPGPMGPSDHAGALIDESGGTLTLGAATLTVPPGALPGPTLIAMRSEPATDTDAYHFLAPLFDLQPEGLTFAEPVTLTIALPDDGPVENGDVYVVGVTPDGIEPLATTPVEGGFASELAHFSLYSLVYMSGCTPNCADFYGCCFDDASATVACVPIDDNLHCGSCSPCTPPDICCDDSSLTPRSFKCVDVKANDNDNCGACGVKCSENTQGRNDCCKGLCVDFKTDPKNCASCGNVCPAGQDCVDSVCKVNCTECVGYDGVADCCPPNMVCHTEPVKGGPCLPY